MMRHLGRLLQRLLRSDFLKLPYSTMSATSKIAVCQMTSVNDKDANYKVVNQLVSDAVKENVQMIFFPEACDYICDNKQDIVKNAEPILTGNTVKKYRDLAAKHNVWLSMGGVHELDEKDPSKMFNTHLIIDNKGEIVQAYRKLHLFDVEIPEKNLRLKESDFSHAGKHIVSPVETPVGKIGFGVADLDRTRLQDVRRNMPVFQHRRKDVYSLHALSLRKCVLPEHSKSAATAEIQTPDPGYSGPTNTFGHVRVPETCVFFKSKLTYAFVNLRCVIPGHVLVAPIREVERNKDLTDEEAEDFYRTIRLVQKLMEKVHDTQSCTVTIQDGPDAGQTVRHLHCHVMPRKQGDFIENDLIYLELAKHDNFKSGHPAKPARTLKEMEEEAAMLKKEMLRLIAEQKHVNSV